MGETIYDPADFGRLLRLNRKEYGLTQRQAAELCGVSPRLWLECETGKRSNVSFDTALRMLQTVGLDLKAERRRSGKPGGTSADA